jgi:transposase
MNILNLPNLKVVEVKEDLQNYRIVAEMAVTPTCCLHCFSFLIVGYGKKNQLYMDLPMHGKRVGVEVIRKRFLCRKCERTFLEILPDMDDKRAATTRLVKYVEKASLERTFASLAQEIGVNEKSIRNIFKDYITHLNETIKFATPQRLGIDEIHILKKPRCVISNLEHQTVINILPKRDKETVKNYLYYLPNKESVRYICMDMWEPYKDAVKICFPKATVIIDKFHVVRMANQALESVRKSIRAELADGKRRTLMHDRFILLKRAKDLKMDEFLILQTWTKNIPDLGKAYILKENFFMIWDCKSKDEAVLSYRNWKEEIPFHLKIHFQPLLTAMENWQDQIFAYFDHPITNAFTESLNGLIRVVNRLGRGYSFDALRAKILFTKGTHKIKSSKYPKDWVEEGLMLLRRLPDLNRPVELEEINYGVNIFALLEMIDSGMESIEE